LGIWLNNQRQAKKGTSKGKISDEQIRKLEERSVWWDKPDMWEGYFAALERYAKARDYCLCSSSLYTST
jgi:hypothetical protein